MSYDQSKVAFWDTETTGLDPELDPVWEIAVIVDGEEHLWQQKLPEMDGGPDWSTVSEWVLENTRIVDSYDHAAALEIGESIDRLVNLISGRHVVGACPWFDSERLHRAILGAPFSTQTRDLPWHYHLIDVENMAVGYLKGRSVHEGYYTIDLPWKSTNLSLALGVDPADFEPKHTALADARWAKALYEAMMGEPR